MDEVDIAAGERALGDVSPLVHQTVALSIFKTASGRQMALERRRKSVYCVWIEASDGPLPAFPRVEVVNHSHPLCPYSASQPRSSNLTLKHTSHLCLGNSVWYLHVWTLESLREVADWYASQ